MPFFQFSRRQRLGTAADWREYVPHALWLLGACAFVTFVALVIVGVNLMVDQAGLR